MPAARAAFIDRRLLPPTMALAAALLFAVGPAVAHHQPGKLHIAAVLSLSGPNAYLAQPQLNALELGVSQLNAAGGVEGHVFTLDTHDDAGNAATSAEIVARFTGPSHVDAIIGGTTAETSIAIARLADKLQTPFISLAGSGQVLTFNRRWVFKTPPNERIAVNRIIEDAARRGIKRVALAAEAGEFGRGGQRELRDATNRQSIAFRKFGVALGVEGSFRTDGSDAAALAAQIARDSQSGAVVVFGTGMAPAAMLKALQQSGSKAPVYLTHGVASVEFLKFAGAAAEGARAPAPPLPVAHLLPEGDPRSRILAPFVQAYRARYAEAPSSFAGYAWDALMMIAEAVRRAPFTDQDWIRSSLERTRNYAGVTGTYNLWPDDHLGLDEKALLMIEARDGAWKIAD